MKLIATDYQALDPGRYPARYGGAELATADDGRKYVKHVWVVELPDGSTYKLYATSSLNFGPKSKLQSWMPALLGRHVKDREEIELDTLKGRRVELVIGKAPRPDGGERNTVEAVLPLAPPRPMERPPSRPPESSPPARDYEEVFPDDDDL